MPGSSDLRALAYFGGFTHTEIAEILDAPVGTVKGRMRLGLEKLANRLLRRVMVTDEPVGGSRTPTGKLLLTART